MCKPPLAEIYGGAAGKPSPLTAHEIIARAYERLDLRPPRYDEITEKMREEVARMCGMPRHMFIENHRAFFPTMNEFWCNKVTADNPLGAPICVGVDLAAEFQPQFNNERKGNMGTKDEKSKPVNSAIASLQMNVANQQRVAQNADEAVRSVGRSLTNAIEGAEREHASLIELQTALARLSK